jgi:hypothetical protein
MCRLRQPEGAQVSALNRFLGDTPLRTALKLIVVSFLVGLVMSAFGWSPFDILAQLRDFLTGIWNMGFRAVERFIGYFLLGAAVVVPAFIILRLFNYRRS